ncbi:MAG: hypothetical protein CVT63_08045 [Candidatus Anoxymicrobium japonicum]|uniref:IPT/TIG domain-containing protein n=1 Tax=Candidatus Anoxymicrobium japonicum TaxID=2013648 RepID=A0A2N3G3Y4_9ACTN|nr:MAG: hypothetical protein CVT63_08045 [Candidatus Anoxymicrobium japonicum]
MNITDLAGTGFQTGAIVRLKKLGQPDIVATSVVVTPETQITCDFDLTGAAGGDWDVFVENADGQSGTLAGGFQIRYPVPITTSISPASKTAGEAGFTLTVNGTNFTPDSDVMWNGASRVTTYVSPTKLTAVIVAGDITAVGTANVTVSNPAPGGGTSNALTFTIIPQKPSITSISPSFGPAGTVITIKGAYFGPSRGAATVNFNAIKAAAADYISWSDTEIVVRVPSDAVTGPVTVTANNGTSNAKTYTVSSPIWYLAEGTSDYGFVTYITIANPNTTAVTALVTYMTKTGPQTRAEISLPAMSQTFFDPSGDIGQTDFSTKVECKEEKTICVDRRMTWTGPGADSPEGHSSVGVTAPAKTWYLPEGSSKWGFETWLLIQNPSSTTDATATVTYMIEGEELKIVTHNVPRASRASFNMETDIGQKDASIKVESDIPVIPERAMYRNNRREGHDSIGTTAPATDYYLAEGTTDWGFTTYLLVQNPNATPTDVTVTYMTPTGAKPQAPFTMPANSRKTIKVNDVADVSKTDLSTKVHGSAPIIAERAMYWDNGTGEACHDSIGMDSPHATFYLPDGETYAGTETWTLVQNPNTTPVSVEISYLTNTGTGNVVFTETIPANSRKTFNMADKLPYIGASIKVTSKTAGKKIMVERAMYWNNRGAGTDTIGGFSN